MRTATRRRRNKGASGWRSLARTHGALWHRRTASSAKTKTRAKHTTNSTRLRLSYDARTASSDDLVLASLQGS